MDIKRSEGIDNLEIKSSDPNFNIVDYSFSKDYEDIFIESGLPDDIKQQILKKSENILTGEAQNKNVHGYPRLWLEDVEPWIDSIISDREDGENMKQSINLLFSASLFEYVNRQQRNEGAQSASELADFINNHFFNLSPNILSNVGDLKSQLELLSLTKKCSASGVFQDVIVGEILLNNSFDGIDNEFVDLLSNENPVVQINSIELSVDLAKRAIKAGNWSNPVVHKVRDALCYMIESSKTPPLVRFVAIHQLNEIDDEVSLVNFDINDRDIQDRAFRAYEKRLNNQFIVDMSNAVSGNVELYSDEQLALQKDYQTELILDRIAPDVCIGYTVRPANMDSLISLGGKKASINDWRPTNDFKISQEDMFLIRVAHEVNTKSKIESELGIKLAEIPLKAQIQFLRFAIESDDGRYSKLVKELTRYEDRLDKQNLIYSFLSLEFGDHFGDRLLNISNKLGVETAQKIFKSVNHIRDLSTDIARYFIGSVDKIDSVIETAWIKRITEVLAIVDDGQASSQAIESAIKVLDILRFATESIHDGLISGLEIGDEFSEDIDYLTLKSDNDLTVTIRPNFKDDRSSQRVGFTVKIPDELIPKDIEHSKNRRLNIRLDYDNNGLSLDIGSLSSPGLNVSPISRLVAETLSAGERIINGGIQINGYHVRESFQDISMNRYKFRLIIKSFLENTNIIRLKTIPDDEKHAA